jgi:hypothetical protein
MKSGKLRLLAAVVVTAAMLATMAAARTVHNRALAAGPHAANGQTPSINAGGAATGALAPSRPHDLLACPTPNEADCEKLEMLLPM